jgi:hypothetical protein
MTFGGEIKRMEITPYPRMYFRRPEIREICPNLFPSLVHYQSLLHQLHNKVVDASTVLCKYFNGNDRKE